MSSPASLFLDIFASVVGMAYFVYGKRSDRASFLLAGAALCVYPFLVDSFWALALLGLVFAAAPFFFER